MFRRHRITQAHTGFALWDPAADVPIGRLSALQDGWLVVDGSTEAPGRTGYLPPGAVHHVDARKRRIVLRPGVDTSHLTNPDVPLERRAERVADAIAHFGLFGFVSTDDGTFLDPR